MDSFLLTNSGSTTPTGPNQAAKKTLKQAGTDLIGKLSQVKKQRQANEGDGPGLLMTFAQFQEVTKSLPFSTATNPRSLFHFLDSDGTGQVNRTEWLTLECFCSEADRRQVEDLKGWMLEKFGTYRNAFNEIEQARLARAERATAQ